MPIPCFSCLAHLQPDEVQAVAGHPLCAACVERGADRRLLTELRRTHEREVAWKAARDKERKR